MDALSLVDCYAVGMAEATTTVSLLAVAEIIHSTVRGIGEGTDNYHIEDTMLALLNLRRIAMGINYNKLTEISRLIDEFPVRYLIDGLQRMWLII